MFYRHVLAYLVLLAAYPHRHPSGGFREELLFAGAGIFGSTLYFLTENYALKYSMASNVGLLLSTTPMLTAIVARFLTTGEPFNRQLAAGFCIAFLGVFLVIFNGHFILKLHPIGDFLAIAAALSWAFYSTLVKKIGNRYNGIYITRKIFFYAIVTMLPVLVFGDFRYDFSRLCQPSTYLNLIFLGVIASSLCFLIWSKSFGKSARSRSIISFTSCLSLRCSLHGCSSTNTSRPSPSQAASSSWPGFTYPRKPPIGKNRTLIPQIQKDRLP